MGWSGGTDMAQTLIHTIMENVPNEQARFWIYRRMILAMEECDWDTQDEARGIDSVFDSALMDLHPDWKNDDDES